MLTIGKLGEAAGVKVPTIRYYEQIGLLPEPERSAGNQREGRRHNPDPHPPSPSLGNSAGVVSGQG